MKLVCIIMLIPSIYPDLDLMRTVCYRYYTITKFLNLKNWLRDCIEKNLRMEDAAILGVFTCFFVTRKTSLFAITIPHLFNASYHGSKPLSKNVMFQILTWKTQCHSPWRNLTAAVVLRSSKQNVTLKQEIDLLSFVSKALVESFHRSSVREVNYIGVDDFKVNFDIW